MKIKFDYQVFIAQKYGGISKYFYYLARELNLANIQADIVSPLYINRLINDDRYVHGIYVNIKSKYLLRLAKYYNMMFDFLFLSSRKYHIVHRTYYSVISGSKVFKHNKNILTVFDMTHEIYPEYFKDSKKVSYFKKKSCLEANKIICISYSTKKDLMKYFKISENKINVIHLGLDNTIFKKFDKAKKINLPVENFILYVGQRSGYKNFITLLKVYASNSEINRDLKLVVFGGEEATADEKKIIRNYKISDKVIFLTGDDYFLSDLYNRASVLVYTSMYEGFGLPVLEAMACGCPVIAFNGSSIPEVAGNACLLLEDILDESELTLNILRIKNEKNLRSKLISDGLEQAKQFSWKKCAQETLTVYKEENME